MKKVYNFPPKMVEIRGANGALKYHIQYCLDGKRKRMKLDVEDCFCIQRNNRFCEHKIEAMQLFDQFNSLNKSHNKGTDANIPIALLLDQYKEYCSATNIHTEKTTELVNLHLNHFWNYCVIKKLFHIKDFDFDEFTRYISYLNNLQYDAKRNKKKADGELPDLRNYSQTTININLRNISVLFNFALSKGYITSNPLSGVGKSKQQKLIKPINQKFRNILKPDEIELLSNVLDDQWKRIFLFFIYTGLRVTELTKLTWSKIQDDFIIIEENPEVDFIPKWNISRRIRINKIVAEILKEQKEYQKQVKLNTPFVFSTSNATAYGKDNLRRYFNKVFTKYNITGEYNSKITPHCFRHTFITALILRNIPVTVVQQIAGHKQISTTMLYVHSLNKQQEVIDDFVY